MSNLVAVTPREFTDKEKGLIRDTVAKGATNEEFNLFLYRCKHMDLDPLKPGQIHFVKYNNSPGTIIVGIEGFRVRAAKTGKHSGTKRGVVRDDSGRCIGAWCEVYRSDWTQPAREEVSLVEYNTGKAQWSKMPETMLKKVAECAALRMAFPDQLGGIYGREEMDQADESDQRDVGSGPSQQKPPQPEQETNPWDCRIPPRWNSKDAGKSFHDLGVDGVSRLISFLNKITNKSKEHEQLLFFADLALKTPQASANQPDFNAEFDSAYDAASGGNR